jgi:hypothetical protein
MELTNHDDGQCNGQSEEIGPERVIVFAMPFGKWMHKWEEFVGTQRLKRWRILLYDLAAVCGIT